MPRGLGRGLGIARSSCAPGGRSGCAGPSGRVDGCIGCEFRGIDIRLEVVAVIYVEVLVGAGCQLGNLGRGFLGHVLAEVSVKAVFGVGGCQSGAVVGVVEGAGLIAVRGVRGNGIQGVPAVPQAGALRGAAVREYVGAGDGG